MSTPGPQVASAVADATKNVVIAGTLMVMFLGALDQTIVGPALPVIGRALGGVSHVTWTVTSYLVTATATAPLWGRFSDAVGRRRALRLSVALFLAGSLVAALAPNLLSLILARALQGAGGGGLFAIPQSIIGDLVPPRERAHYAAWNSGVWGIAGVAGPLLGGVLTERLGWSSIFWINLPIGIIAFVIADGRLAILPEGSGRASLDLLGSALIVLGTALTLYTLTEAAAVPWPEMLATSAGALLAWIGLGFRLYHASTPLIVPAILQDRTVLACSIAMFLMQGGNLGLAICLPGLFQSQFGMSPGGSGLAMLAMLLATVAGAIVGGRMIRSVKHPGFVAAAGAAVALISAGILASLPIPTIGIELLTAATGAGSGACFPVAIVLVQSTVDRQHIGSATGVLTFMRSLGGAFGVTLLGAAANGAGLTWAFGGAAGAFVLAHLILLLMPRRGLARNN